jgi:hypothetical protein
MMYKFRPLLRLCSALVRIDIAAGLVMTAVLLLWLGMH